MWIVTAPLSAWAIEPQESVEVEPHATESSAASDPSEPEPEEKKRFWLTDPAMIEQRPLPAAMLRTFPLKKELAGDKALPRPLGVALSVYWQKQDYDVTSAVIQVGDLPPFEIDTSGIDAKIDSRSLGVKADLWVLPFLNLYAGIGTSETDADIFIRNAPIGINPPDRPGGDPEIIRGERFLFLEFDGPYWVVGGTFVGGYKRWFGSLSISFAQARLDANVPAFGTNNFDTERALPKIGYSFKGTSVWLGAAWIEETFETGATFDDIRIDVEVSRADWTPTLGMNTIMGERWDLTVEGGFGDRVSALFNLGYRF
jgi:hypothetical protein